MEQNKKILQKQLDNAIENLEQQVNIEKLLNIGQFLIQYISAIPFINSSVETIGNCGVKIVLTLPHDQVLMFSKNVDMFEQTFGLDDVIITFFKSSEFVFCYYFNLPRFVVNYNGVVLN